MPEPNDQGTQTPAEGGSSETQELNYETWVKEQPKEVQAMLEQQSSGLTSALKQERGRAKDLEKELRDAAKKLEENSEVRKGLEATADQIAAYEKENKFYDLAHKAGARSLRLAYMAAEEAKLVRDDGSCDFAALKEKYPELFGPETQTKGNAGAGTNSNTPNAGGMNDFIRASAGRKP